MKTLNESLIEEFNQIVEEYDFGDDGKEIDIDKLKNIYSEFLKYKKEKEDLAKASRTIVNTVLNQEFE